MLALTELNHLTKTLRLHAVQSAQITPVHAKELKPIHYLLSVNALLTLFFSRE